MPERPEKTASEYYQEAVARRRAERQKELDNAREEFQKKMQELDESKHQGKNRLHRQSGQEKGKKTKGLPRNYKKSD